MTLPRFLALQPVAGSACSPLPPPPPRPALPNPSLSPPLLSAKNWFDSTLPSSLSQSSCCWVKTIWEKLALWYELITYHLCSHKNCLLLFCPFKSSFYLFYNHRTHIRYGLSFLIVKIEEKKRSSSYLLFPFHSQAPNELCKEIIKAKPSKPCRKCWPVFENWWVSLGRTWYVVSVTFVVWLDTLSWLAGAMNGK